MSISNKTLIVLNGDLPNSFLDSIPFNNYDYILAADGALNLLLDVDVIPHAVVGDFDSISKTVLESFHNQGGIIDYREEQETTDFEKALLHLKERKYFTADVIGYHGSRIDHLLAVLHAAIKWMSLFKLRFCEQSSETWLLTSHQQSEIADAVGVKCSIIPLLPSTGVTLHGFCWRLEEEMLALGSSISCSNEIVSKTASVFLQQGALLIQLHRSPYPSFIPNCNH